MAASCHLRTTVAIANFMRNSIQLIWYSYILFGHPILNWICNIRQYIKYCAPASISQDWRNSGAFSNADVVLCPVDHATKVLRPQINNVCLCPAQLLPFAFPFCIATFPIILYEPYSQFLSPHFCLGFHCNSGATVNNPQSLFSDIAVRCLVLATRFQGNTQGNIKDKEENDCSTSMVGIYLTARMLELIVLRIVTMDK